MTEGRSGTGYFGAEAISELGTTVRTGKRYLVLQKYIIQYCKQLPTFVSQVYSPAQPLGNDYIDSRP